MVETEVREAHDVMGGSARSMEYWGWMLTFAEERIAKHPAAGAGA